MLVRERQRRTALFVAAMIPAWAITMASAEPLLPIGPPAPDASIGTSISTPMRASIGTSLPAAATTNTANATAASGDASPASDLQQAESPAAASPPKQEQRSLGRNHSTSRTVGLGDDANAGSRSITDHWMVRTAGALAIVIGLALLLRMLMRAVAGHVGGLGGQLGAGGRAPSGVMLVLARYPIARGQTLVLLQLDRRILLLNQTPAGFATLSEVVDTEEVASIIRKCEAGSRRKNDDNDGFDAIIRSMERDPEVASGRLDGQLHHARQTDPRPTTDTLSKAQALINATRRGAIAGTGRGA